MSKLQEVAAAVENGKVTLHDVPGLGIKLLDK